MVIKAKVKKRCHKTATLTPANKAFTVEYAKTNNGTQSVLKAFSGNNYTIKSAGVKATRLLNNDSIVNHIEYQKNKLEQLATKAVNRVEQLIDSDNEQVASMNSWKSIEQVQGKAIQRNTNLNIEANVSDIISKLV